MQILNIKQSGRRKRSEFLYILGIREGFLTMIQNREAIKEKVDKFHYRKIKICMSKSTIHRVKRQVTNWQKIFQQILQSKDNISIEYSTLKN